MSTVPAAPDAPAARRSLVPHRAHQRLLVALVLAGVVVVAMSSEGWPLRLVAAWDVLALVMLSFGWATIWRSDAAATQRRAAGEDPGRYAVWLLALVSSTFSLFTAIVVLRQAHTLAPGRAAIWAALCLLAIAGSWLLTHTSWALRYAHLYYRDDDEGVGGLNFPGDRPPDAFDFAYFAFTIGICFQVSDVTVTSPQFRRAVLFHACQAFGFTTAIVALALNLAFALAA